MGRRQQQAKLIKKLRALPLLRDARVEWHAIAADKVAGGRELRGLEARMGPRQNRWVDALHNTNRRESCQSERYDRLGKKEGAEKGQMRKRDGKGRRPEMLGERARAYVHPGRHPLRLRRHQLRLRRRLRRHLRGRLHRHRRRGQRHRIGRVEALLNQLLRVLIDEDRLQLGRREGVDLPALG